MIDMNIQHIITGALVEYDSSQPTINYLKKNTNLEYIHTQTETKRNIFVFRDKDTNEKILETEVEILGVFYDKFDIWTWAWSQTGLLNSENYLSKEILIYALKLGKEMSYLKSILTTSRGVIKDKTQVDINLALGAYIIKQPYLYPYEYIIKDHKLTYYVILLNKEALQNLGNKIKEVLD
jgi:hypothetical protein